MHTSLSWLSKCLASMSDASKLCFTAAIGFATVGTASFILSGLPIGCPDVNSFLGLSLFYVLLGGIEILRSTRFAKAKALRTSDNNDGLDSDSAKLSPRIAA